MFNLMPKSFPALSSHISFDILMSGEYNLVVSQALTYIPVDLGIIYPLLDDLILAPLGSSIVLRRPIHQIQEGKSDAGPNVVGQINAISENPTLDGKL